MLDVIQLELGGMPGVVALGSASISERHLLALEELGIASVVLALDADPAGLIGTDAFIELARERSPQLRVTVIPAAALRGLKDPGELVAAHGTQAIRDAIDARVPAAVFQAQQIVGSLGPEAAVAARRDALAALTGLAERLEGPDRDADLEDLASLGVRHLGYSEEVVRSHLGLPSGITLTAATSVREVPSPYGLVEAPDADDRPSAIPYPPNLIRILGGPMYSAEISRRNPTALVFLLDQSGSMAEDFAGTGGQTKSAFLATVINRQLQELVLRCTKDDGIRDYFHVAVLGYGSDVYPALSGGKVALIPVSEVGASPLRIEQRTQMVPDGVGGLVEQTVRFPVWVDPVANGATSMSEALRTAQDLLAEWIEQHPDAFPPTIINVTDGASTDGDPTGPAQDLRSLATRDGTVFLFNIHTSGRPGPEAEYLETDASLADPLAKQLFSMSSQLPDHMVEAVSAADAPVRRGARGFLFNANPTSLTRFLSIGTRPANDLR
jgi:hypothetical protein